MIRVDHVRKRYPGQHGAAALDDLSLHIDKGEFFTLFGPSGCGKSTLLRCLAGLETPDGGEIAIDGVIMSAPGVAVPTYRRRIGMVFQSYAIWPHMTVFANVAFPLEAQNAPDISGKVMRALDLVGLADFAQRSATQLSGGQQQRVALARAIVAGPRVLLLDEPLSNLDVALREEMRAELRDLQRNLGVTTVLVTHDQTEALSMSDRIAVMSAGRIIEIGSPDQVYFRPGSSITARQIGGANVLDGDCAADGANWVVSTALGKLRATIGHSGRVRVMIRPENIIPLSDPPRDDVAETVNVIMCRVRIIRFAGQLSEIELIPEISPDLRLRARVDSGLSVDSGTRIGVTIDPACVHVLAVDV